MTIVHLTASRFFGGPERQMLDLARAMTDGQHTLFASFAEDGCCRDFLDRVRAAGFEGVALHNDTPHVVAAQRELFDLLKDRGASVLCCHGYKADMVGAWAGRRAGIPVVAVSRGWTGESLRVGLYEAIDRRVLRSMHRVVCVSEGQAAKVRRAGVDPEKIVVIRNAIRAERFGQADPASRQTLEHLFPRPYRRIVVAAGRLSVEKGFDVLIDAASHVARRGADVGFVLFGEGTQRPALVRRLQEAGLSDRFLMPGFRADLDRLMPAFDVLALPSHTEGLPNVVLEAFAAGVPVVATAVGGTPEVIDDGRSGYLVAAGDSEELAARLLDVLGSDERRRSMGEHGRARVRREFTFAAQAARYRRLFAELTGRGSVVVEIDRLLRKAG